jgi:RNA-binding protein
MDNLTIQQKKKLKSLAHHLKPVIQLGKHGLTESLFDAIKKALEDHELIKIKFIDHKEDKKNFAREIEEKTDSVLLNIIGNIAIFYKQNPDIEKQQIKI